MLQLNLFVIHLFPFLLIQSIFINTKKKGDLMNVFIILSILIIVIGVLLLVVTPSVLFKLNWKEKTGKEKILMLMFYSILVYIINIIYWIIK